MPTYSDQIQVSMKGDSHIENITLQTQHVVQESGLQAGTITVFVQHTTASIMVIEDEPGIRADTRTFWNQTIPANPNWEHNTRNPGEDNGHSHLQGQLQGPSMTIPFLDKKLTLGTWQQIVLIDFDTRPRTRNIIFQLIGE